jgi:hypothetical protein
VASTNSAIIPKIRHDSLAVKFCAAVLGTIRGSLFFAVIVFLIEE